MEDERELEDTLEEERLELNELEEIDDDRLLELLDEESEEEDELERLDDDRELLDSDEETELLELDTDELMLLDSDEEMELLEIDELEEVDEMLLDSDEEAELLMADELMLLDRLDELMDEDDEDPPVGHRTVVETMSLILFERSGSSVALAAMAAFSISTSVVHDAGTLKVNRTARKSPLAMVPSSHVTASASEVHVAPEAPLKVKPGSDGKRSTRRTDCAARPLFSTFKT